VPLERLGRQLEQLDRQFPGPTAEMRHATWLTPEHPALRPDMSKTDWCSLERHPELRLAVGRAPDRGLVGNHLGE
jgi:hypothetical protein